MLTAIAALLILAVAAPWIVGRHPIRGGWILALAPAAVTGWLVSVLPLIGSGSAIEESYAWAPRLGVDLAFRIDGLSLLFALLIAGIGTLVVIYTGGYMKKEPDAGRFFAYLLAFMASMLGVVFAENLLLLFVFWELTSFTSFLMIGFESHKPQARQAALQALLVTGAGGLAMLAGLILLGSIGQSDRLTVLLDRRELILSDPRAPGMLSLLLLGAFTKSAQFPFHFWLPNAMAAPAPASAYLHSSTMVKAGIYLLARLSPIFVGWELWTVGVTSFGAVTMLFAAMYALQETHLKRLLAYTTLCVLGLLVMLLGIGSEAAVKAAVVYLIAHALYKAALFLVAGMIQHETEAHDVEDLGGLARPMSFSLPSTIISALSMAGLAGTFGFIAKEALFEATLHAPLQIVITTASVVASLFMVTEALYFLWQPFFGAPKNTPREPHQGPLSTWMPSLVLSLLTILIGVMPGLLDPQILTPAVSAIRDESTQVSLKLWHGFTLPLMLDLIALGGGIGLLFVLRPVRHALRKWESTFPYGPDRWYEWSLKALNGTAKAQTRFLQNGYLRYYLMTIVLVTIGLVGSVASFASNLTLPELEFHNIHFSGAGLAVIILAAAVVVIRSKSRVGAITSLGVVGYGVGLLFVMFGAPDLAITQFVIETLTVILFVLVFHRLKAYPQLSKSPQKLRDAVIALTAGSMMTGLVLLSGDRQWFPSISHYYREESVPQAHGHNIVNVILVDFRVLDTLGEITVISAAALGVFALLKLWPGEKEDQS